MQIADVFLAMNGRRPKEVAVYNEKFCNGKLAIDAFADYGSLWDLKQSNCVFLEKNLMSDVASLRALHMKRQAATVYLGARQ
eukprot:16180585-Heterocapsa_arctica.AAC.1